jgi:hypothetical protein
MQSDLAVATRVVERQARELIQKDAEIEQLRQLLRGYVREGTASSDPGR